MIIKIDNLKREIAKFRKIRNVEIVRVVIGHKTKGIGKWTEILGL